MVWGEDLDNYIKYLEGQMESLRNTVYYGLNQPIVTSGVEPVDINELEDNMQEELGENNMPQKEINKLKNKIDMSKAKKFKPDKSDISDKDNIITIDRTVCVVPARLQSGLAYLKKPFVEYTNVEEEPFHLIANGIAPNSTSKIPTTLVTELKNGIKIRPMLLRLLTYYWMNLFLIQLNLANTNVLLHVFYGQNMTIRKLVVSTC